jgi:hypothetical protein
MTVNIFEKIFSNQEVEQLRNFYSQLPVANTRYLDNGKLVRIMKNSEYNLQDQLPFKILNKKLTQTLGPHQFTGGHWMDSHYPFYCHVDSLTNHVARGITVHDSQLHKNIGLLIPLSENKHFHTVFFDHMFERLYPTYMDDLARDSDSSLDVNVMNLLDHHTPEECEKIKKFKLSKIVPWTLGSMFSWPRNQLHCSSNFEKYGLTKQAIVLWL